MRLPKSPYIYFRFVDNPSSILIHCGSRKGEAKADMARIVREVQQFAVATLWPTFPVKRQGECNRESANYWQGKPPAGSLMLSFDGTTYTRWTHATDAELTEISRHASGLLMPPPAATGRAERYPQEPNCRHERLNEDGICRRCGADCRGIY